MSESSTNLEHVNRSGAFRQRLTLRHHYMQPFHDTFLRYHTIDRVLRRSGVKGHILEIGCGNWGLAAWRGQPVIGVDMRFSEARAGNIIPLVADATRLPFADAAFDAVISSDMLEHLPPGNRRAAVSEMLRVTSRVLVLGVPVGVESARQDRELLDFQRRHGLAVDPMIAEHVENGLPTRSEMIDMLKAIDPSAKVSALPNFNLRARRLSMFYTLTRAERLYGTAALVDYWVTWLVRLLRPVLHVGTCYRDIYIVVR